MEGDGDYREDKYYEGDGGLNCVYLPDASKYGAPEGRLGGDWHPSARRRGLPLFHSWSLDPIIGRAMLFIAGSLPEAVLGMVVGLLRTLVSLLAALSLGHSIVGAAAVLVLSVIAAAVATEYRGRAVQGRWETVWGQTGPTAVRAPLHAHGATTRTRQIWTWKTLDVCCIPSRCSWAPGNDDASNPATRGRFCFLLILGQ